MPGIDWSRYLMYFSQIETCQRPLGPAERTAVEELLADLLGFDPLTQWGTAGGFGNVTEVVVHLHARPRTASLREAASGFDRPLAIRVMRTGKGGLIPFHQRRARTAVPLNGPEHRHFPRDLAAGCHRDRFFVLHEWVEGETIEWRRRNEWETRPPSGTDTQEILRQLLLSIVVPAWSEATETSGVLWDIRDANFVMSPGPAPRLVFVDTGTLRHLVQPSKNREGQIGNGLRRLSATMKRILRAQGRWRGRPRGWDRRFREILDASALEPALRTLPGGAGASVEQADAAARRLLTDLHDSGFFRPVP